MKKRQSRMRWEKLNIISLPLQALASCVIYYLMEAMSRHSFGQAWTFMVQSPLVFIYNAGIIFVSSLIVYVFRHRAFVRGLLAFIWLFLGALNGVILASRVTPFTGPDLHLLTDAVGIAEKYLTFFQTIIACIVLVLVMILLVYLCWKGPKFKGKMHRIAALLLTAAGVVGMLGITQLAIEKRVLSNYFGNIAFAYEDYGYPYCLITTIFNTGINQPHDYSKEEIERIQNSGKELKETSDNRPNIIFLQLESFFDPTTVNYLKCSEDPIPNFRELMKNYSSGFFKVPSVGAGTANTEFETITGMSLRYFGPGEYPYKSILKTTTCESAPFVLSGLGYTTYAMHNNEANFYGRKDIFPNLGFDVFVSAEFMDEEDDQNVLGWTRDRVLTKNILNCIKATDTPDYIYAISVQGHGDYPTEPILDEPVITVSGSPSEEQDCKWEYYCNQIYEMDQFVKELTDALSELDEDVVLVMYGDHLPTMDLGVEDVSNRYLFQTEYVIWDNMGLKKKDVNLSSYQIASEVMKRVGIHEGNIFRYHQARRNSKNYQVDMETLQYDLLYGEGYAFHGETPYVRKQMRLGLAPVTVDSIAKISDYHHTYYIYGSNFTPSTEVKVNGEWCETAYLTPNLLMLSEVELTKMDKIKVCQRSNSYSRKELTATKERLYYSLAKIYTIN